VLRSTRKAHPVANHKEISDSRRLSSSGVPPEIVMSEPLAPRLEFLRTTQNPDGGWGFFPGKQSWLEPTAYALMALHGDASSAQHFERGWKLVRSWQLPDG